MAKRLPYATKRVPIAQTGGLFQTLAQDKFRGPGTSFGIMRDNGQLKGVKK